MLAGVVAVVGLIGAGVGVASTRAAAPLPTVLSGDLPAAAPVVVPQALAVPAALPDAVAAAGRAAAAAPVTGTPCRQTARACVDLSARQAWLIRDGVVEYGPVPITSGRPGWRTPPGTFRVSFKDIDHLSRAFDLAPMPYSVFFNGGIAFHEGSLRQLSHGCIHLSRAAAQTFFGALAPGDVVQVAG